ncbi:hypothetical protein DRW07_02090 [Alteromonas sediminis]|uniref:Uncharacterized protein n=1 Tax=Alteromonas sediminis TaxID=2259342 RepID=A0A3N5YQ96_9ALTE|nr:hypothetical protein [Alteromonas sediminis]RPJ68221.1 hypothetical protein DRW07_02090 [Alteromonas sediminis]
MGNDAEELSTTEAILQKLTAKNLAGPTIFLGVAVVLVFILFFVALGHATFSKLDANTEYSVRATTQIIKYSPNNSSIPTANLAEFQLVKNIEKCPRLTRLEWLKGGELKFYANSTVTVRVMESSLIQINVEPIEVGQRAAELTTSKGRCVLKEKVVINVKLSEMNSELIMILIGDVTIGKQLSYDTKTTPLLLEEGEIAIKDKSFWFEDTIFLPDIELSKGDTVVFPADKEDATIGLVTISHGDTAFEGVFTKKGGQVRIVKPFANNDGDPIEISFFERLYSDNALAIAISASFIVIQLLMYLINTLIRLTFIPKPYGAHEKSAKDNKGISND